MHVRQRGHQATFVHRCVHLPPVVSRPSLRRRYPFGDNLGMIAELSPRTDEVRMVDHCELEIRVRYAECDPMGYLHHSKYFEYFEMGRTELLRASGSRYRDLETMGVLFVVAKVECRFRRPARYDDVLVLHVRITRQSRARIDHEYKIYRDGVLLCEASTILACVNREGQPIPIPEGIGAPADAASTIET